MEFSALQIAGLLGGTIEGNAEVTVNKLCKIEEGEQGGLSFLANPKYTGYIYDTKASIVIVSNDFVAENTITTTLIRVENAYQSFAKLLEIYNQIKNNKKGIEPNSYISTSAKLGTDCYVGAFGSGCGAQNSPYSTSAGFVSYCVDSFPDCTFEKRF